MKRLRLDMTCTRSSDLPAWRMPATACAWLIATSRTGRPVCSAIAASTSTLAIACGPLGDYDLAGTKGCCLWTHGLKCDKMS